MFTDVKYNTLSEIFRQNIWRVNTFVLPLHSQTRNKQIKNLKSGGNSNSAPKKMEKTYKTIVALAGIALINKDGYTVDAATLHPVTSGYAVAVAATQNSFGPEGLAKVVRYVQDHQEVNAFGGWYNSENNQYYYDATIIVESLELAIELGRANDQIAIFDLANCKEIRL